MGTGDLTAAQRSYLLNPGEDEGEDKDKDKKAETPAKPSKPAKSKGKSPIRWSMDKMQALTDEGVASGTIRVKKHA